ncbi:unnamed protein product, partial [marine sediment metagenome]
LPYLFFSLLYYILDTVLDNSILSLRDCVINAFVL